MPGVSPRRQEYAVCGRLAQGYTNCLGTQVSNPAVQVIQTFMDFIPGQPLELWLLPANADNSKAIGRLLVIPPEKLKANTVLVAGPEQSVTSTEDLVARASAGEGGFVLR